jgi:uncharacterized protein (TIGR00369 family)
MEAHEVLASWQRQEDALYAGRTESDRRFGVASLEQVAGKSGLDIMRSLLSGELPAAPIAETMDFTLIEVEHGRAVFQGRPLERHYNPLGSVHGGWFATLLDSALGCAVHTALPAGKSYTTLELKVNMIRALTSKVGLVRAEGRVIHVGGQVATSEAKLVDAGGKLYAHGTTTCLIFDLPQKRPA